MTHTPSTPDSAAAPWLVLTTPHADRVTENFADQVAAGLRRQGKDARVIVVGRDLAEQLRGVPLLDVAGVVTIGPLPLSIAVGSTPLYRMLRCPVYYYILDTLIYDLLRMPVAAQFIADAWSDERLVPVFAEKQFLNAWRAGADALMPPQTIYVPFAAFPDQAGPRPPVPVQQRLLVIGSIGTELHARAMRPDLGTTLASANTIGLSGNELARLEDRLLAPGARGNVVLDLFDALALPSRAALDPAVQQFVSAADSFIKRHRRVIAAESLRGVPVDFVGSGWQPEFGDEPSFRFMGNLPHGSLTRLTSLYAALVNFDPNWEWGMHDRVFSALSVGVPVFTHANFAPAEEGLRADQVIAFAPNAPALAAPAHALLAAPPAREPASSVDWGDRMQRLLAASPVKELVA